MMDEQIRRECEVAAPIVDESMPGPPGPESSAPEPDKLQIEIEVGSDACQYPEQVGRLLRGVAAKIEAGDTDGPVKDLNGNTVGFYRTVC